MTHHVPLQQPELREELKWQKTKHRLPQEAVHLQEQLRTHAQLTFQQLPLRIAKT
uniref:Uncharacterized protein n=1 Tax=Peronospora matthiolae TaxID=2874970 RepID=A0AAV1VJP9_9STRA